LISCDDFSNAYILLSHLTDYGKLTRTQANILYNEYFVDAQIGFLKSFGHNIKRRKIKGEHEWYLAK
jgi:hypothetical protein